MGTPRLEAKFMTNRGRTSSPASPAIGPIGQLGKHGLRVGLRRSVRIACAGIGQIGEHGLRAGPRASREQPGQ
jgi:hypothetical protein